VSDRKPIHHHPGTLPEKYKDFSLLDFYHEFDWGVFVHIYDWYDEEYTSPVKKILEQDERTRRTIFLTPRGEVSKVDVLAADGTWAPKEHFVKTLADLERIRLVVDATDLSPGLSASKQFYRN
jgi:hypothetical protein